MKRIEREKVRLVLVDFANLAGAERREFLGAINEFLFSSPQRRRVIKEAWEQKDSPPPATTEPRACDWHEAEQHATK
jgi:hypothetical protein